MLQTESKNPLGDLMRRLEHKKREEAAAHLAAEQERRQKEADFHLSDAEDYFPDDIRDARVSGHTSCKLLELPPDILNVIVDHSLPQHQPRNTDGHGQTYTAALKHLRLIHPCFAYLRLLLNRLFASLTLRADPDQLRQLQKGLDRIAPFVKKVNFCTTKVKREDLAQSKRRDRSDEIRRVLGRRAEAAVKDGRLLATWSGVLQQCSNLQDFAVVQGLVDAENIDLGPSAQTLIEIGVKCIIAANKKPHNISIEYLTDHEKIWTTLPEWKDLNFTELENLSMSLTMGRVVRKYCACKVFKREARSLLSHVLQASSGTLQTLTASGHTLETLIDMDQLDLPALRELDLNGSNHVVDPVRLARMITHFSGLQKLRLEKLSIKAYRGVQYWHPIFRAIRQHVPGLVVELIDLGTDSALGPKWKVNAKFQLPQPVCKVKDSDTREEAIITMIKNYLSKHGEWYLLDVWNPVFYEERDPEVFGED